jgi:O-antigen/teichoic acid export membrane protein
MSREAFGEFNLALTGAALLGDLTIMPMAHTYYRNLSRAEADGSARSAGLAMLRWYLLVTLAITLLTAAMTRPLSGWLHIGPWTALGAGLLFLTNRWRGLGIEVLDMRRRRRACALQNLGFLATNTVLTAVFLSLWSPSAASALAAFSLAAAIFAWTGAWPVVRDVLSQPKGHPSGIMRMMVTFGAPYGALLLCQWVQNFAERYIVGIQLNLDAVGAYVAAYQVCGVPYMLLSAVINGLGVPIAYERARVVSDPKELWAADKVLLLGIGAYVVLGALAIPVYAFWGPSLMRLLTSETFVLGGSVIVCLALARYVQCLGQLLQAFFAVHQRMGASLGFRVLGGLLVVPVCWFAVRGYGVTGAAAGVLASGAVYTLLVCFCPGGCLDLLRGVRRQLRKAPHSAWPAE